MKSDKTEVLTTLEPQAPCEQVYKEKYAQPGENRAGLIERVANALSKGDHQRASRFQAAMHAGFIPGGRINASAGTDAVTTMINCFVQPVGDTMTGMDGNGLPGIMDAQGLSAETLRRGGGVGYDFSSLRPKGAKVKGTHSRASGPVSYMRVFDRMCETVESAGARRGAQMGVLRVDHPDIIEFIDAKKMPDFVSMGLDADRAQQLTAMLGGNAGFGWAMKKALATLSNFNMSVAVTDAFMAAVAADAEFDLVHEVEPFAGGKASKVVNGKTLYVYDTVRARELWDRILNNTYTGAEPGVIFIDRVNLRNNLRYAEEIRASNPCGEQMLPAYGCCCLGSVDLGRFVDHPFTPEAQLNTQRLSWVVATGVELLDSVLDCTRWPLPQQAEEAQNKRRIGFGYLGLADAMAMMNIRYDSPEGVEFARYVTTLVRNKAYEASVDLARKHGAFPLLDAERYLEEGTFASTLPQYLQDDIREFGIRNSHLLSIAPTGTISMAFGDNASSGIEPIFALEQGRHKMALDGTREYLVLKNRAVRMYEAITGLKASDNPVFVTAQNISVDAHLEVLGVVANLVDSAVSKTVNVPGDYPFDAFKHVYARAYELGCKGITTYRPNEAIAAVLVDAKAEQGKQATAAAPVLTEAATASMERDRRVELKANLSATDLSVQHRPETPKGVEGKLYQIPHPAGEFAVMVTHYVNGHTHPLDVYVAGGEQPRGIAPLAKLLSLDLRQEDAAWTAFKLASLGNLQADDAFAMPHPATGAVVQMPSLVAGFASVVRERLTELGVLGNEEASQDSAMLQAMYARKEPKTDATGALGWGVDIANPATGDDFHMFTKEIQLSDGTVRPYSIWFSGKHPGTFHGLAKVLSIDLRVSDPMWAVHKLRKLITVAEPQGDFLAFVPGQKRQQSYPSTVAYIAAVLLHRLSVLGLVREDAPAASKPAQGEKVKHEPRLGGMQCPKCHAMAVHKVDGCELCDNCGHSGSCG